MEEKQLSEKESLELISSMIHTAKNQFFESGTGAIIWGITNFVCFFLAYLDWGLGVIDMPFNPFFIMIIAFLLQWWFWRKERKEIKVKTYNKDFENYVWGAFAISVFVVTFAGAYAKIGYWVMPFLLVLYAVPTYVSGKMTRFKPFVWGAYFCWLLSIAAFVIPKDYWEYTFLFVAIGVLTAWVIPGFILNTRYRKAKHTAEHV